MTNCNTFIEDQFVYQLGDHLHQFLFHQMVSLFLLLFTDFTSWHPLTSIPYILFPYVFDFSSLLELVLYSSMQPPPHGIYSILLPLPYRHCNQYNFKSSMLFPSLLHMIYVVLFEFIKQLTIYLYQKHHHWSKCGQSFVICHQNILLISLLNVLTRKRFFCCVHETSATWHTFSHLYNAWLCIKCDAVN